MARGKLQIDILGTSFAIQAEEDSAYLEFLLGYYRKIIKQIENSDSVKDPLKIAVLAGIMLCDELYKEKKKKNDTLSPEELAEAERITLKMISSIDEALG